MTIFEKALLIHLVCDWLLQNEWMALNKKDLRHPAAWVHSGIHFVGLCLVFPAWVALLVAVIHALVDTRVALITWRHLIRQTTDPANPASLHIAFWGDQVVHLVVLALAIEWFVL